jgi:hypothetical protein
MEKSLLGSFTLPNNAAIESTGIVRLRHSDDLIPRFPLIMHHFRFRFGHASEKIVLPRASNFLNYLVNTIIA